MRKLKEQIPNTNMHNVQYIRQFATVNQISQIQKKWPAFIIFNEVDLSNFKKYLHIMFDSYYIFMTADLFQ